jgi:hypothetical protein
VNVGKPLQESKSLPVRRYHKPTSKKIAMNDITINIQKAFVVIPRYAKLENYPHTGGNVKARYDGKRYPIHPGPRVMRMAGRLG